MKDFKEDLKTNFIPRIKEMIAKEEEHLQLVKDNTPKIATLGHLEMEIRSESFLSHLQLRLQEYENYVKD